MYYKKIYDNIPEPDFNEEWQRTMYAVNELQARLVTEAYRKGLWRQLAYGIAKLIAMKGYTYAEAYSLLSYETPKSEWLECEAGRLAIEITKELRNGKREDFRTGENAEEEMR